MGAPNFGRGNASKIFAIFFPYKDEETEDYIHPESWEIQEGIENIKELLNKLPYRCYEYTSYKGGETNLIELSSYKNFGDVEVYVQLNTFLEHGYHEGARLDWRVSLCVNGSEYESEIDSSQLQHEFSVYSDMSKGLQTIQSKNALKWLESEKEKMIEEVEKVYDEVCELKMKCIASFSNGEAIYQKID